MDYSQNFGMHAGIELIDLKTQQTRAIVNALLFAMSYMSRFCPELSASGLPGTII